MHVAKKLETLSTRSSSNNTKLMLARSPVCLSRTNRLLTQSNLWLTSTTSTKRHTKPLHFYKKAPWEDRSKWRPIRCNLPSCSSEGLLKKRFEVHLIRMGKGLVDYRRTHCYLMSEPLLTQVRQKLPKLIAAQSMHTSTIDKITFVTHTYIPLSIYIEYPRGFRV